MVCNDLEGWDGGAASKRDKIYAYECVCITDSLCCVTETKTTLWSNYSPVKNIAKIGSSVAV